MKDINILNMKNTRWNNMYEDDELDEIVPDGGGAWHIVNSDGVLVDIIKKDDIIRYCERELKDNEAESLSPDTMIHYVWHEVEDDFNLDPVDHYCQYWDKFTAWFDYVVVEYFAQEIVSSYKQRLLDFE